jgi:hypothetical protein
LPFVIMDDQEYTVLYSYNLLAVELNFHLNNYECIQAYS